MLAAQKSNDNMATMIIFWKRNLSISWVLCLFGKVITIACLMQQSDESEWSIIRTHYVNLTNTVNRHARWPLSKIGQIGLHAGSGNCRALVDHRIFDRSNVVAKYTKNTFRSHCICIHHRIKTNNWHLSFQGFNLDEQ